MHSCKALADVYFTFAKWSRHHSRDEAEAEAEAQIKGQAEPVDEDEGPSYEDAVAAYQKAVAEAQAKGLLPASEH